MIFYSVIVPVYNRPNETKELLESLALQTYKSFEIILVEDGSTLDSKKIVEEYNKELTINYFFKPNSGPGNSRNFGMQKAQGDYLIFFDSDCIIPKNYFEIVTHFLNKNPLDCFGGPDNSHKSFSDMQKAINVSMTSMITTGGIRGRKKKLDNFQPRTFNMGFTKEVYEKVGGFTNLHPGEDPDLSYRILDAGFRVGLIPNAEVYHKRRIDLQKFSKQVTKFGKARIVLMKWHPTRWHFVYFLPSIFLLGSLSLILMMILVHYILITPLILLAVLFFFEGLLRYKSLKIAFLSIASSFIQLGMYGYGFLVGFLKIFLFKKQVEKAMPEMFFLLD